MLELNLRKDGAVPMRTRREGLLSYIALLREMRTVKELCGERCNTVTLSICEEFNLKEELGALHPLCWDDRDITATYNILLFETGRLHPETLIEFYNDDMESLVCNDDTKNELMARVQARFEEFQKHVQ